MIRGFNEILYPKHGLSGHGLLGDAHYSGKGKMRPSMTSEKDAPQDLNQWSRGNWVSQSVGHPSLDLCLGLDLRLMSSSPMLDSMLGLEPT